MDEKPDATNYMKRVFTLLQRWAAVRREWKNSPLIRGWWLTSKIFNNLLMNHVHICGSLSRIITDKTANMGNALLNTYSGNIYIGAWVNCGQNVSILTGTHDPRKFGEDRLHSAPIEGNDIYLGEGAWLCSNVTLLGPCQIGEHAVVAAGAVVVAGTQVPPYSIFAGIPAKNIGSIPRDKKCE